MADINVMVWLCVLMQDVADKRKRLPERGSQSVREIHREILVVFC